MILVHGNKEQSPRFPKISVKATLRLVLSMDLATFLSAFLSTS